MYVCTCQIQPPVLVSTCTYMYVCIVHVQGLNPTNMQDSKPQLVQLAHALHIIHACVWHSTVIACMELSSCSPGRASNAAEAYVSLHLPSQAKQSHTKPRFPLTKASFTHSIQTGGHWKQWRPICMDDVHMYIYCTLCTTIMFHTIICTYSQTSVQ